MEWLQCLLVSLMESLDLEEHDSYLHIAPTTGIMVGFSFFRTGVLRDLLLQLSKMEHYQIFGGLLLKNDLLPSSYSFTAGTGKTIIENHSFKVGNLIIVSAKLKVTTTERKAIT